MGCSEGSYSPMAEACKMVPANEASFNACIKVVVPSTRLRKMASLWLRVQRCPTEAPAR